MKKFVSLLLMMCVAGLSSAAYAQSSTSELMVEHYAPPNEFYLFNNRDVEVMSYKKERDVRICTDQRRHNVPLEVTFDGNKVVVHPGYCFQFEAKRVTISPAAPLEDGWDLNAKVETIRQ